ncbi:MAG: M23 family metallopeptidase [Rikenellaceae bacterium]
MIKIDYKKIVNTLKTVFQNRIVLGAIKATVIIVATFICYYFLFAVNFDTPIDAELKTSLKQLREEYDKLSAYNDEIDEVLLNLEKRDSDIYFTIFNSYPELPNLTVSYIPDVNLYYENDISLIEMTSGDQDRISNKINSTKKAYHDLEANLSSLGVSTLSRYPSIQPITNKDLLIKITPAGRRIDPFYKGAFTHYGIDYLVAEGTRVFATASGTVSGVTGVGDKKGIAVTINHGNGYTTTYAYLKKAIVSSGQSVALGEIIGYSGNTGISFVPHLHYEVKYNGRNLDPTDFFFRELDPHTIKSLKKSAEQNILALD